MQSNIQNTPQANKQAHINPQQLNIEGIGTSGRKNDKLADEPQNFTSGISLSLTNKVQTDSAHLTEYVGLQIKSGDTSTRRNNEAQNVETQQLSETKK